MGSGDLAADVALNLAERCRALCRVVLARAPLRLSRKARRGAMPTHAFGLTWRPVEFVDPYLVARLRRLRQEELICLFYDGAGAFRAQRIRSGGTASVGCAQSSLLRDALDNDACYAVVAHNHPSGDGRPSPEDVEATRRLHRLFATAGIMLVDHVIVARGGDVFSFLQAGLL